MGWISDRAIPITYKGARERTLVGAAPPVAAPAAEAAAAAAVGKLGPHEVVH